MLKKIIIGLIVVALVGITPLLVKKWAPNLSQVDPLTYFDEFKKGQENLVFEDKRIALVKPVMQINGELYVSYEFAKEYIDSTLYYDAKEEVLTITDPREVIRMYVDSHKGKSNFEEIKVQNPIKEIDGMGYIPYDFLNKRYGFILSKGKDGRLYVSDTETHDKKEGTAKSRAVLRTRADRKSVIVESISKGDKVTLYAKEGNYYRARSSNGIIGYLAASNVKNIKEIPAKKAKEIAPLPIANPLNDKVRLVWDQLTVKTEGNWNDPKYTHITDANVISPTWFEFGDEKGNLIDRGTRGYILEARKKNMQVWALLSHNFDRPELTKAILQSSQKRQYIIDQIAEKSQQYGFEGINIDIENIQADFSDSWVQFMRELYPQMKELGITVSVDVYIPSDWSGHYEREKVAEVVDYFIVMAYDEHWSGSEEPGSVASFPWVENGLVNNLKEVPKEKLILGIPFYTRIWEEHSDGLKSAAYSMQAVQDILKRWGTPIVYDEDTGQDYSEREKNGILYKVWIENEKSIAKRIELIKEYDLAGYACWKLGLETKNIWNELEKMK